MQEWILLDSQSTTSIFCNPTFVEDIATIGPSEPTLTVETNGGTFEVRQKARVPQFGTVWYDPNSITNIFSHAEMADRYRITYDNKDKSHGDSFVVHTPKKQIVFRRLTNNLYVHKPLNGSGTRQVSRSGKHQDASFLNSVKENRNFYSERQFEKAKQARDLYHAIGTPSINDFKAVIRMNAIGNNPITTKDIDLAEKIFGPDIGSLKGKSTRRNPVHVVDDQIEIPRELIRSQQDVTLCIDAMKVNTLWFLTTISRNLYYRTVQYLPRQTADIYRDAIVDIIRLYNRAGMKVERIHADNEFRAVLDDIRDILGVQVNYANPQEHVPEAERNNRTIKERIRATYHRLPFTKLPRIMVKILAMEAAKKCNFFPARHGISDFYSPRMILHGKTLDYEKHCRYAFGTYVQVPNEPDPTNTNAPRTLDCIYLRYTDSAQGGHDCLHLPTNRIVTRGRVTPIPITSAVITQLHAIATRDRMPPGLKIQNRMNIVLYDSSWIPGVDFEDSDYEDDDSDYSTESTDSEDDDDEGGNEQDDYPDDSVGDDTSSSDETDDQPDEMDLDYDDLNEEEEGNRVIAQENANPNEVPEQNEPVEDQQAEQPEEPQQPQQQPQGLVVPNQEQPNVHTRSGREVRRPERFRDYQMHLQTQAHPSDRTVEYDEMTERRVIARIFEFFNFLIMNPKSSKAKQFVQTYSLKKGLRKFGKRGESSALKEMKQLDDREVYYPIRIEDLTDQERKRAMESLIFMVEKRDGTLKSRFCANGSTQRAYMEREESASPTVMTESILITGCIEAKQRRDVMTCDIPNAFVQTDMNKTKKGERVVMKIRGALVDILLQMDYEKYADFVTEQNGRKILYVVMSKALYGMLESALLYYRKFRKDIEERGYTVNPYDPCVANKIINGRQHTICWHVDDLKSSHVDKKVNDEFLCWLNEMYGKVGPVKATRGVRHDYLAMFMDYSKKGKVVIDMVYYVEKMVDEFPGKLRSNVSVPWNDRLFKVDEESKKLDKERAATLYTFVMKAMFLCKRARPDIQPAVAFLATRVKDPTEQDYKKLVRMLEFLKETSSDVLTLEADDIQSSEWWVDAAFAVHPDYKSHTGATHTLGKGMISS